MLKNGLIVFLLSSASGLWALSAPNNLKWETNDSDPTFADPLAEPGGTAYVPMSTFPLTLRVHGPDANTVLYLVLNAGFLSLTGRHAETLKPIPLIATHWAYDGDGKTIYYKLNKTAKWSDGKPVTADDFVFALDYFLSENIVDPLSNNYYMQTFDKIVKYDDHTISVSLKFKKPNLIFFCDLPALPKHFYGGSVPKNFVQKYNWQIVPNTGAYIINEKQIKRGKSVTFERKKDWWGDDLKYFKKRFNIEKIVYQVVREAAVEYEMFKAGKLSFFSLADPKYWYGRADEEIYKKGYVERGWVYNDVPWGESGLWMNQDRPIFKDLSVRLAFQHAMNFDRVIKQLLRNEYVRIPSVSPNFGEYSDPKLSALEFSLAKADEYFKKAGWTERGPDGVRLKNGVRLYAEIVYSTDLMTDRLLILQEDAHKAGIDLQLRRLDWSSLIKMVNSRKHDIVFMGFGSPSTEPHYFDSWHSKSDSNLTSTNIPELDQMIEAYREESNEIKKKQRSIELQRYISNIAAFIPGVTVDYLRFGYWRWFRLPSPAAPKISKSPLSLTDNEYGGIVWFDQQRYDETQKAIREKRTFAPVSFIDETNRVNVGSK